jgi:hypothetical protein
MSSAFPNALVRIAGVFSPKPCSLGGYALIWEWGERRIVLAMIWFSHHERIDTHQFLAAQNPRSISNYSHPSVRPWTRQLLFEQLPRSRSELQLDGRVRLFEWRLVKLLRCQFWIERLIASFTLVGRTPHAAILYSTVCMSLARSLTVLAAL